MSLHRIHAVLLRYYYLMSRSMTRFLSNYIWITISMFTWGFTSHYLSEIAHPGFNLVSMFLGAALLSDFMGRVTLGIVMTCFEDVWARNFLNFFASPLRVSEYLIAMVISGIITSLIGLAMMVALAVPIFHLNPFAYGPLIVPHILILFEMGIALGIFGIGIVLRLGPSSEWLIWPIPALISPFVGVFYPIASLPHWMQSVATILPPSYVFEGIRSILSGTEPPLQNLFIGLGLGALYILGACWFFYRAYARAIRTGIIARYSAESSA